MTALSLIPREELEEQAVRRRGLSVEDVVGEYFWQAEVAPLLDFEQLDLNADGTYVARVEATLLNPNIRTFGPTRCMLPEEGHWNIYAVSGNDRLRIRPTTSRARVYAVAIPDGRLTLSRRGERTTLVPEAMPSGPISLL